MAYSYENHSEQEQRTRTNLCWFVSLKDVAIMFDDYVFHLTSAILPAPGIRKRAGEAACQNNSDNFD